MGAAALGRRGLAARSITHALVPAEAAALLLSTSTAPALRSSQGLEVGAWLQWCTETLVFKMALRVKTVWSQKRGAFLSRAHESEDVKGEVRVPL